MDHFGGLHSGRHGENLRSVVRRERVNDERVGSYADGKRPAIQYREGYRASTQTTDEHHSSLHRGQPHDATEE